MEKEKKNVNNKKNLLPRTCKSMLINEARHCDELQDGLPDFYLWEGKRFFSPPPWYPDGL